MPAVSSRLMATFIFACSALPTPAQCLDPTSNGRRLWFRTSEPGFNIRPTSLFRLDDPEKAPVRSLRALMAELSCPSTQSETTPGKLQHLICGTISAWIAPHWTTHASLGRSLLSHRSDGVILYSRCNFSQGRRAIHCFDLLYPQEEKRSWDAIVTRISLSLRPLEG